jgi:hypothetical protein
MHCHSRDTLTEKYKKWDAGGPLLKNTSAKNWHFSAGMSRNMMRQFNFVNIAGGAYHDVTPAILHDTASTNT